MPKEWNSPTEVALDTLPATSRTNPEHLAFYEDILRRPEQTPAKKAIRYTFGDYKTADKYASFVRNRANKLLGHNKVKITVSKVGGVAVFAYRGPEW